MTKENSIDKDYIDDYISTLYKITEPDINNIRTLCAFIEGQIINRENNTLNINYDNFEYHSNKMRKSFKEAKLFIYKRLINNSCYDLHSNRTGYTEDFVKEKIADLWKSHNEVRELLSPEASARQERKLGSARKAAYFYCGLMHIRSLENPAIPLTVAGINQAQRLGQYCFKKAGLNIQAKRRGKIEKQLFVRIGSAGQKANIASGMMLLKALRKTYRKGAGSTETRHFG